MSQLILQRVREQMIDSMTELALTRDNETGLHIQRTKLYVKTLAQASPGGESYREQLSDEQIEKITAANAAINKTKVSKRFPNSIQA